MNKKEINSTDYKIIEIAKRLLLKKCMLSVDEIYIEYDGEKDAYTAEKYESWLEKKLRIDEFPEMLSGYEIKINLDEALYDMYEKEKNKIINIMKNKIEKR